VHDLPAPQTRSRSPEEFLDELWSGLAATASLPAFVREAVSRVRDEPAPVCERALVLSHNDVNPTKRGCRRASSTISAYNQRLASALCAAMFLHLARQAGHAGASGGETIASAPSLSEFYQRARSGAVSIASPDGQWEFGLALAKASTSF
jgi:hypothetical protein